MKITFVLEDRSERIVNFREGQTILQVADENHIPLQGVCEGMGICGTCNVTIENLWNELPEISEKENNALDNAFGITMQSRLACQIVLDKSLSGLRVIL